jgi:hypothetical protein
MFAYPYPDVTISFIGVCISRGYINALKGYANIGLRIG